MTDNVSLLTTYRAAKRAMDGRCPMCERDRAIVFVGSNNGIDYRIPGVTLPTG